MRRRHSHRRGNNSVRNIVIVCCVMTFLLATSYAAFQTVVNINAKGTIKNLKQEVDSKILTNDLLFWGQADNPNNTNTILKDKSGKNNDGVINGATFQNNTLEFDGVDDYVDLGLANYDFKNSISFVAYVKANKIQDGKIISNAYTLQGGSLWYGSDGRFLFDIHNNIDTYVTIGYSGYTINQYNALLGTYDGKEIKLYVDAKLVASNPLSSTIKSPNSVTIGSLGVWSDQFSNMSLKEVMVYDRALTSDEIKTITQGFARKYDK